METSLKRAATISKVRELQLPWTEEIENEYDILREIGSGDYGKVSLAKHKTTGTEVNSQLRFLVSIKAWNI